MLMPGILNYSNPEKIQKFANVLLDQEGYLYTFHNDIPVFLQGAGLNKVGKAHLELKRKKLYAVLLLHQSGAGSYDGLYPHLLHNTQGYVFGILLSDTSLPDTTIGKL